MRLGFIGTGRITTALVEGFCTTPDPPASIIVSPRNAEKAAQLAVRFRHVTVAKDNQAIVDGCDCVFLALRPPMVSVLGEIRFRPEQRIISLMPTRPFTQSIAAMFHALSALAMEIPDGRYSSLVADSATPGGLNEQVLREIRERNGYRAFLDALDSILTRMGGTPCGRRSSRHPSER